VVVTLDRGQARIFTSWDTLHYGFGEVRVSRVIHYRSMLLTGFDVALAP
jgi:hypothetical protein